jgi:beta-glucosidase
VDAVVLVVGFTHKQEGEYFVLNPNRKGAAGISVLGGGGDRSDIRLGKEDVEMIRKIAPLNPRTVVVYVGGSAIGVDWRELAPAILFAYYPGMEGGSALARVLFGEVNPSGRLPFTIPQELSVLPDFDPFGEIANYGLYHGYTLLEKLGSPPAYAFGFGLGYTRFRHSDLEAERVPEGIGASVRVENTGDRPGSEVVQLYIGFPGDVVDRPSKLLRGFRKIRLQPGECQKVSFMVPMDELSYWDEAANSWKLEPGEYRVLVGPSSRKEDLIQESLSV